METTYTYDDAKKHMEMCATFAQRDPVAMARTIFLAVGSIRIHSRRFWQSVLPNAFTTYSETGCLETTSARHQNFLALEFKRAAIAHAFENMEEIFHAVTHADCPETAYLWLIENVPGLGIAKAGFVVQMIFGAVGCLDSVNLKRFGIAAKIRTPAKYLETVAAIGEDPVMLWFRWCETVAKRDGLNAFALSLAHAEFVAFGHYDGEKI